MRLFQRYTRISLLLTLTILVAGFALLFIGYRYLLIHQVDEALELEQEEILAHIKQYNGPPRPVTVSDLQIQYKQALPDGSDNVYRTVTVKEDHFRELTFYTAFDRKDYQFSVRLPLEQTETLLALIGGITLTMLLAITLLIYALNRRLVRQLIAPFHHSIAQLERYSGMEKQPLQLPDTPIEEFTLLNRTLNEMTARIQRDVEAVRRFTAQAAHEMQTPLAVMRNQLEALLQTAQHSPEGSAGIAALESSVAKMSRLFRSLLLLTRIEGGQFEEAETVALDGLLREKLQEAEDLMGSKGLRFTLETETLSVRCNRYLAEVLLQNLLFNAVRYAQPGGELTVKLAGRELQISNTSELRAIPPEDLGRPFYRNPNSRQSGTGLGLSIATQIAARYGWQLHYHFENSRHLFKLLF